MLAQGKSKTKRKVRAVVGVPAEAMRVNKQHLRNVLKGAVDGLMIVSEPFAVAYGLALKFAFPMGQRWLETRARQAADREATIRRVKNLFRGGGPL